MRRGEEEEEEEVMLRVVVEEVVLVLAERRVVGRSGWRRICRAVAAPAEQDIVGGGIVLLWGVIELRLRNAVNRLFQRLG